MGTKRNRNQRGQKVEFWTEEVVSRDGDLMVIATDDEEFPAVDAVPADEYHSDSDDLAWTRLEDASANLNEGVIDYREFCERNRKKNRLLRRYLREVKARKDSDLMGMTFLAVMQKYLSDAIEQSGMSRRKIEKKACLPKGAIKEILSEEAREAPTGEFSRLVTYGKIMTACGFTVTMDLHKMDLD